MPLLDGGGRLIGVIGAAELLSAMVRRGADPAAPVAEAPEAAPETLADGADAPPADDVAARATGPVSFQ